MLVRRTVTNVEGSLLNESSVQVENRTDAVSRIVNEQRAFPSAGFEDRDGYYWARTGDTRAEIHRWTIVE